MPQTAIPFILMRGGTSKGPYFRLADLPDDPDLRDKVLLAVMGSPDVRQIDGIGGADSLTSKVCMVGPSDREGVDVDFLFAQVSVDQAVVDTGPSCGNMLSGVGPFAIERGYVEARDGTTDVRVYNINTEARIDLTVKTPRGVVEYEGDDSISGVPGTAAPVICKYMNVTGSKTAGLMPTGNAIDVINGVEVSCIDVAMPCMFIRASDLGLRGDETRDAINGRPELFEKIEAIRLQAGRLMGLGDVTGKVTPKVALLSEPGEGGHIRSRYLTPTTCHAAHAVTGGMAVAAGCLQPGTIADDLVRKTEVPQTGELGEVTFIIEHPSGILDLEVGYRLEDGILAFVYGGVLRTARKLMEGSVYVPSSVWG